MASSWEQMPAAIAAAVSGGLVGAIVSAGSFWERAAVFAAGAIVAFWFWPVFGPFFHATLEAIDRAFFNDVIKIDRAAAYSAAGFLLGVTGMTVVGALKRLIEALRIRAERTIGK